MPITQNKKTQNAKLKTHYLLLTIIFLSSFFFIVRLCHAFVNEDIGINTKAMSLGNSVTAYTPGIMPMHYNPAGLTSIKGKTCTIGAAYPFINIDSNFLHPPADDIWVFIDDIPGERATTDTGSMYIPVIGNASTYVAINGGITFHAPGSKWYFGYGMYTPFGMGYSTGSSDPTRFGVKTSYNQRWIYAAPAVACRVSKTFSLGASIGLGQGGRGLSFDYRSSIFGLKYYKRALENINAIFDFVEDPGAAVGEYVEGWFDFYLNILSLEPPVFHEFMDMEIRDMTDSLTTSFNIGMLWEPVDWITLGLCYRSKSEANMEGDYNIKYSDAFKALMQELYLPPTSIWVGIPYPPVNSQRGTVTQEWTWPRSVQVGIMVQPSEKLKLMCDLHWTDWSEVSDESFEFDQDIQILQFFNFFGPQRISDKFILKRKWKDTYNYSFGVEYNLSDRFSLRFGYEDRESSVDEKYFDLMWPVQDMKVYSCGAGIAVNEKTSVDLGFSWMLGDKLTIRNNTGKMINSAVQEVFTYAPYGGIDYEQETSIYLFSININRSW